MWPITKSAMVSFVTVTPSEVTAENTGRNINGAVRSIQTIIVGGSDRVFLIIHI
jgi:hypothetical protein